MSNKWLNGKRDVVGFMKVAVITLFTAPISLQCPFDLAFQLK